MVEAIVLWNEPNNLSHWNFKLDPEWRRFAEMIKLPQPFEESIQRYQSFSEAYRPATATSFGPWSAWE